MKIFTPKKYPWACKVTKVDGGYMCFELGGLIFEADYQIWKKQK